MISPGDLAQIEWRNPWWLLLALQPLLIAALVRLRHSRVLHYAEAHLRPWAVLGHFAGAGKVRRAMLVFPAWLLLAVAAAGPRLPLAPPTGERPAGAYHAIDIMVALDVSPSMAATDISPQRLERARLELDDLLRRLRGERVGLVAFSGSAGLLAPLTDDYDALRHYLKLAEPSLFENAGSNIAAALDLARSNLPSGKSPARAVLLLTDGESSASAKAAAARLHHAGIALYVLGVGSGEGARIPLADGGYVEQDGVPVVSRMDEAALRQLAALADGRMAAAEDGDGDWNALYDRGLLALPGGRRPPSAAQDSLELYPWFLFPALMLLVASYRPAPALAMLLAGVVAWGGNGTPAYAADNARQDAWSAFRGGNFALARTLYGALGGYDARMGEGASAYRRRDYTYAVKQFSAAMLEAQTPQQRADAMFNLGNGFYLSGNLRAASDAFAGVLKLRPGDKKAQANWDLASGKLAREKKLDPYSEGILGRRGEQTGGGLGVDIADLPVYMDATRDESGAMRGDETGAGEQARLREQLRQKMQAESRRIDPERLYRAAQKKLELVADQPAALQKEMLKLDAPRDQAPQGMPPW
jgi:Ca-activated chloride channel family protein